MKNNNKSSERKHQISTRTKPVLTKHGVLYRPFAPIGIAPVLSQVAIGAACASYWRGCWQVLYLLFLYFLYSSSQPHADPLLSSVCSARMMYFFFTISSAGVFGEGGGRRRGGDPGQQIE